MENLKGLSVLKLHENYFYKVQVVYDIVRMSTMHFGF